MAFTDITNQDQGKLTVSGTGQHKIQGLGGVASKIRFALKSWLSAYPTAPEVASAPGLEHELMEAVGDFTFDPAAPVNGFLSLDLAPRDAGRIDYTLVGPDGQGAEMTKLTVKFDGLSTPILGWLKEYAQSPELVIIVQQKCGKEHFLVPTDCKDILSVTGDMNGTTGVNKTEERMINYAWNIDGWAPYLAEGVTYPLHSL